MKLFILLIIAISLSLSFNSCDKDENDKASIEVTGILQEQGITTYQYGTHILGEYTLRSSTIDLNNYVGQSVMVTGHKVDGYPVEGGPDYLEVETIQ